MGRETVAICRWKGHIAAVTVVPDGLVLTVRGQPLILDLDQTQAER